MSSKDHHKNNGIITSALLAADRNILRVEKLFSTPAGIDVTLSLTYYVLRFTHARLLERLSKQYERLAVDFAAKASGALVPGDTVIATIEAPQTKLSETCTTVKTAAGAISDFRAFTRLWGLLGIYSWARGTYLEPPKDEIIRAIIWVQIFAGFWYAVLENGAYLVTKGVLRGPKWSVREEKWYRWSSSAWLVHIVLEAARMLRAKQLEADSKDAVKSREADRQWQLDFYRNASWAPLAYHWSVPDGQSPVTETYLGLLGAFPGIVRLRGLWAATA
ncbi:hypothetical protein AMS68_000059 [Peltaster fructicola]|uniref:Uncharacterized protein n=1 Tax=Peltaster fructicola TaxID=286661 RepID=A0A6H0XIK3_9PEZI|nr:hypothetical protein AMS68_000059 [Peltaster fructicola]